MSERVPPTGSWTVIELMEKKNECMNNWWVRWKDAKDGCGTSSAGGRRGGCSQKNTGDRNGFRWCLPGLTGVNHEFNLMWWQSFYLFWHKRCTKQIFFFSSKCFLFATIGNYRNSEVSKLALVSLKHANAKMFLLPCFVPFYPPETLFRPLFEQFIDKLDQKKKSFSPKHFLAHLIVVELFKPLFSRHVFLSVDG